MPLNSEIIPGIYGSSLMIVDDDVTSRIFIERALRECGFNHLCIVENGTRALSEIARFQPDLIILDIFMEGLNGLECCLKIREMPDMNDLPVLMLTAQDDETLRFRAFEYGATDFVTKPLHPSELHSRVKVHLMNRITLKALQKYKLRLDRELHSARELQAAILPSSDDRYEVESRCKLQIASHLQACSEIGGDFWGMKSLFTNQTAFWLADFSGHGVAAALNAFHLQAYLREHSELYSKPGDYVSHLNEKLLHLLPRGHFATLFYGIIDTRGNKLHYSCACAPHPFILRSNGKVEMLDGSGTPLGICLQFYPTQHVDFNPGDTLILYSDAFTETADFTGKFLNEPELMKLISMHKNCTAEDIKANILEYFSIHSAVRATDDLTLCIIRRTG